MFRFIFRVLFLSILPNYIYCQAYNEGFEPAHIFSLSGFITPEESPLPQSETYLYLGYGCWCSTTGGVAVVNNTGRNNTQGIRNSPNTSGQDLLSPRLVMETAQDYTFSFWYNTQNAQDAEIVVYIDIPDDIENNFEVLETISITSNPGTWEFFEYTYTAPDRGNARFRLILNNSAGGQRIRLDDVEISPSVFADSPCNPDLPPTVRFKIPETLEIPESNPSPQNLEVYRLGYISQDSRVNIIYSGGSATVGEDFNWLVQLPYLLSFTQNTNTHVFESFEVLADALVEPPQSLLLQIVSVENVLTQIDDVIEFLIIDEAFNNPPLSLEDSYSTLEDEVLIIEAPGVLVNDIGLDLQALLVSPPQNGTIDLQSDGSFSYEPFPDFFGQDFFGYRLRDDLSETRVKVNTLPINDVPVFLDIPEYITNLQTDQIQEVLFSVNSGAENEVNQSLILSAVAVGEDILESWALEFPYGSPTQARLTFTPDPFKSGIVLFHFTLRDSGGTERGGLDQSQKRLRLTIQRVAEIYPNEILLPNTFTPNNDTNNDYFVLRSKLVEEVVFTIFDKWGNVLYHTQNVEEATQEGWDGLNQPTGMYAWAVKVKFQNGESRSEKGKVHLLR